MKSWQLAVLGLALLAIGRVPQRSDHSAPRTGALPERSGNQSPRWQIEDLQDVLNSGEERSVGRDRTSEEREPEAGSRRNHRGSNGVKPPETERGTPTDKVPDALRNPGGLLPSEIPEAPENIRGPTPNKSSGDGQRWKVTRIGFLTPRHVSMTAGPAAIPFNPSGDSRHVASIVLDPALTGGIGSDERFGRSGLAGRGSSRRDARDRIVDAPAEVNVTAFDRELKGEAARVARWDFTPAETASLVPPHGQQCGGPPGDGLARQSAETPQAATVRAIHHGRRPEVGGQSVDRDRLAWRQDRPLDARRDSEVSPIRGWSERRRRRHGVRTRRGSSEASAPRRTSRRVPPEPKSERPVWSPERR